MSKKINDVAVRNQTRPVPVGDVLIGGDNHVVVQSMTNTETKDVSATISQVETLREAGCELVRLAVPDPAAATAFGRVGDAVEVPLVADVHFDHELALQALQNGADKVRINPGNIGAPEKFEAVVAACKEHGAAMRVGVNSGSLSRYIIDRYGGPVADALVESALEYLAYCQGLDFDRVVVSLKASRVPTVIEANRKFARESDYPLHVGVTEAGSYPRGAIKTAAGLGGLLRDGIGDTVRVSLTGDPVREVEVAYEILQIAGRRRTSPEVVTCPTCARLSYELEEVAAEVRDRISDYEIPVRVAIMGCVVNGPGEAREADVGIAGGEGGGVLFRDGEVLRRVDQDEMVEALLGELEEIRAAASE